MHKDELPYKILQTITDTPETNQRAVAGNLGVSLGRVNYCLQALIEKGLVKVDNFRNNKNKLAYAYLLTPTGIEEKARLTIAFLRLKLNERKKLESEIEELQMEVNRLSNVG
jgi:EPS-associated MarR family transcriptional regulator